MKLGTPSQAIPYLEQALALSGGLESKVVEPVVLLGLGEAYRDMRQLIALRSVCIRLSLSPTPSMPGTSCSKVIRCSPKSISSKGISPQHCIISRSITPGARRSSTKRLISVSKSFKWRTTPRHPEREAEILRLRAQRLEREIIEQRKLDEALQVSHDALERQVKARTAELSDAVALLKQEIVERERAEAEIQQMVETLEQRVAERTDELATFFDLTLLAGQAVNLNDIFEQALPRIIEVTRSHAICIHLFDADRTTLRLAAQQDLSAHDQARCRR